MFIKNIHVLSIKIAIGKSSLLEQLKKYKDIKVNFLDEPVELWENIKNNGVYKTHLSFKWNYPFTDLALYFNISFSILVVGNSSDP